MGKEDCVQGAENKQKIIALENKMDNDIKPQIKELFDAVTSIKDTLLQRPSWAVTVIITLLSSTCVGLLVLVSRGLLQIK